MIQFRLLKLVLMPSALSFAVVTLTTLIVMGAANWSYFVYNPGLYDFFYGDHGVVTLLEHSPGALNALQEGLATSPLLYAVGIIGFALLAATVVFLGIRSLEHGLGALRTIRATTPDDRHERFEHALIRLAVFILWVLHATFSFVVVLPFCLLLARIGAEDLSSAHGLLTAIWAIVLYALVLHSHVIFARLFCMRPRVFGGEAVIESIFFT